MLIFEILAEKRIREAIDNGEMDDLPGAGQRMVNHILKRAGMVPSDVSMRQAIGKLRDEIRRLPPDDEQTESRRRELTYLLVKAAEERSPT